MVKSEHRFRKHRQAGENAWRRGMEKGHGVANPAPVAAAACQPLIERKPAINIMFLSWGRFYNGA